MSPFVPILLTLAAFLLDCLLGDPQNWPHPVRLIGRLIVVGEKACRRISARLSGSDVTLLVLGGFLTFGAVAVSALTVYVSLALFGSIGGALWFVLVLYLCFTTFCLKDLLTHVRRVEGHLAASRLNEARRSLSWIVGRDTAHLDEPAVRRALIETMAENFADGVVAPLLYLALGGPVLAYVYKAVNTLDSMVGYKNEQYLHLGRASARLDDLMNFVPARIAALLLIAGARLTGLDHKKAYALWRKEGRFHSSPNSGQTEAAMAGAIGVYLGGPSLYAGQIVVKPTLGEGLNEAAAESVRQAAGLVRLSAVLGLLLGFVLEALMILILSTPWGWGF
ncbi:MAG: adenosylcobinamide-phosphate synthase CbiB [Deltaproteobacteria bacterium]|nr:adenosylcobinamide-phosphate synthase CbiB [Deltaproteobacteria bacterium]